MFSLFVRLWILAFAPLSTFAFLRVACLRGVVSLHA